MNPNTNARVRSGFTLIELLVVIAIIAILAAILFPVFAQAREKARQTSCLSNMKQLSTATMQYVQDFDETYPVIIPYTGGSFTGYQIRFVGVPDPAVFGPINRSTWFQALHPYYKSFGVLECPSAEERDIWTPPIAAGDPLGGIWVTYMPNGYLNAWPEGNTPAPALVVSYTEMGKQKLHSAALPFPWPGNTPVSRFWARGETYQFRHNGPDCTTLRVFAQQIDRSWWIHNQGTNHAYMDGHVKWIKTAARGSAWAPDSTVKDNGVPNDSYNFRALQTSASCQFYRAYMPTPDQTTFPADN